MVSGGYGVGGPGNPGEAILAQVRQGAAPPTWRIWRASERYFIVQIIVAAVLILALAIGLISLLSDPNHAFVIESYGSSDGSLDYSSLIGWRTFDFAAGGLVIALLVFAFVRAVIQSMSAADQLLVLLPEGFVLGTGKQPKAYFYTYIRAIKAINTRGVIALSLTPAAGGRALRVQLDGRFGKAKPITEAILQSHIVFARSYQQALPPR